MQVLGLNVSMIFIRETDIGARGKVCALGNDCIRDVSPSIHPQDLFRENVLGREML